MGLVSASKHIYYSICPPTGASVVTAPTSAFTYSVNVGTSGTAANANFGAWTIEDLYVGCGQFWKYGITGTAGNLAKLQYPEPGKTLSVDCTRITDCLAVRVIDTSVYTTITF